MTATDLASGRAVEPPPLRWKRTPALELMGEAQNSGLRNATYLIKRGDGQIVQVSRLLDLVIREIEPERTAVELAVAISERYGRELSPTGLEHLVTNNLQPLGLIETADSNEVAPTPRPAPILSLTLRGTLLPPGAVQLLAAALRPLYWPVVVWSAVIALAVLDWWVFTRTDSALAISQVLTAPSLLLVLFAVTTASSVIHELGHATATRYGGARPGRIGFGIYIVSLAFFTDVTDSYRLPRGGRIRTDLGGLYFDLLTVLGMGAAYLATGHPFFLVVVVLMQLDMVPQLLPAVRFDGYYVLSDLAGVPDLFARVKPVLRSLIPGTPTDPRVLELRPAARRIVVGWVCVVVPLLTFGLGWLLWNLPFILSQTITAIKSQAHQGARAWASGSFSALSLSVISLVLVALPVVGIGVIFWRLGRSLVRSAQTYIAQRLEKVEPPPRRARA